MSVIAFPTPEGGRSGPGKPDSLGLLDKVFPGGFDLFDHRQFVALWTIVTVGLVIAALAGAGKFATGIALSFLFADLLVVTGIIPGPEALRVPPTVYTPGGAGKSGLGEFGGAGEGGAGGGGRSW